LSGNLQVGGIEAGYVNQRGPFKNIQPALSQRDQPVLPHLLERPVYVDAGEACSISQVPLGDGPGKTRSVGKADGVEAAINLAKKVGETLKCWSLSCVDNPLSENGRVYQRFLPQRARPQDVRL
jgi:hypothetical protein